MNQFMPKFAAAFLIAAVIYLAGANAIETKVSGPEYVSEAPRIEVTPSTARPVQSLRDFSNALVEIAEATSPGVVTVFSSRTVTVRHTSPFDLFDEFFGRPRQSEPRQREQRGQGSGVIVSEDGYILTNHHVIANADTIQIRTMGNVTLGATVVGSDPQTDVAVLKVDAKNLPYLNLGDSDELRVGEWVLAIGSPLSENLAHTVTQGIVSAKGRSNINLVEREDFIQTDAAINPGNSGGPLINLDGEVIGINTAIASRSGGFQGIGFAIPINMARHVMDSLIETGRVIRGFVGVTVQDIDHILAQGLGLDAATGVIVLEVADDSPAREAGLREEDIILEVNGQKVTSSAQFRNYVASRAPGTRINLKIMRDDATRNVTVILGELETDEFTPAETESMLERFGFAVEEFTPDKAREHRLRENLQGALVSEVDNSSQAYSRGLRAGDLVVAVNRTHVSSVSDFVAVTQNISPGEVMALQIIRQNQRLYVSFPVQR